MRIASVLRWTAFGTIVLAASTAFAYRSDPPSSRTAAPAIAGVAAEGSCVSCHDGSAVNTGGSVELLGVPAAYVPGANYTLTLRLSSTQTASNSSRRWGFEVTGVQTLDGAGAGNFANIAGQGTLVSAGSGNFATRQYVKVDTQNHTGVASPVEWQMSWTAPAAGAGPVSLYFIGLAGNGSGSSGDYVYTGSTTMAEGSTPVGATTWGAVKSIYDR